MTAFSCKPKDKILLPTLDAAIEIVQVGRGQVRLRVEAPPDAPVLREPAPALMTERGPEETRLEGRTRGEGDQGRFLRLLSSRLEATALQLGVARLQLDAGLVEAVKITLAQVQEEFQLLRYGVEGEVESPPLEPRPGVRSPRTALLVEDDCNQRELLARFLRQAGLQVDTAGDGSDALDYLGSHGRPDVVLLDMGLPTVDGPTTVREIRRNPAYGGLKIFGVTGRPPQDFDLERGPRGIDRWFHKPLDPAALVHELAEELDGILGGV